MKIKEVIIYTDKLIEQLDFYTKVLEFKLFQKTSHQFSLQMGSSLLTFKFKKNMGAYHFALNIPVDKEIEALQWLKKRVTILPYLGKEIADFKSWNASAIYFYDKDLNIVEFIARRDMNIYDDRKFSTASVLNISEIGLATINMNEIFAVLNAIKKIDVYGDSTDHFCAIGNEEGMFIMVNPNLKKWIPVDDKVDQSDFIIRGDYNFEFAGGKIHKLN